MVVDAASAKRNFMTNGRFRLPWALRSSATAASSIAFTRGGGDSSCDEEEEPVVSSNTKSKNATVEEYVAAVEEKDAQYRSHNFAKRRRTAHRSPSSVQRQQQPVNAPPRPADDTKETPDDSSTADTTDTSNQKDGTNNPDDPSSGVGVKSHSSSTKKSNAVGDPDGDDSDDDDGDDDTDEDDTDILSSEEEWEEFEELEMLGDTNEDDDDDADLLQVEMEVVEGEEGLDHTTNTNNDNVASNEEGEDDELSSEVATAKSSGGGGVARLAQRLEKRKSRNNSKPHKKKSNGSSTTAAIEEEQLVNAWLPHIYLPPSPDAVEHLVKNARLIDSASKTRLDRRTLYAALLLEWLNRSASNRKFLDTTTAQSLQAALSLATQPQWRRSFPRPSIIRLFEHEVGKSCTLGMQETIAMALVRAEYLVITMCCILLLFFEFYELFR